MCERPELATRSKTSNRDVAADVRRRMPWEIAIHCPPRYLGGYFFNELLTGLVVVVSIKNLARRSSVQNIFNVSSTALTRGTS